MFVKLPCVLDFNIIALLILQLIFNIIRSISKLQYLLYGFEVRYYYDMLSHKNFLYCISQAIFITLVLYLKNEKKF